MTDPIKVPERPRTKGDGALLSLTMLWLVGTPVLGVIWFSYGFALIGAPAKNKELSQVAGHAMVFLGLGVPPLVCLLSLIWRRRVAALIYGLTSLALMILVVTRIS
ncbi:hypothetical protein ACIBG4_28705 [Nonomuraea sp. NPDC050383]|uniref:hypothetical protein n=1 Tax=Nonomuraea sp. NPDC050383 TaxID=3364362 RepID=UPI00379472BB